MYRIASRALIALAATASLALAPAAAQARRPDVPTPRPTVTVLPTIEPTVDPTDPTVDPTVAPVRVPRLVDVRFASHRRFDRLVFDFRGGVPDAVDARLVRFVRSDSGRLVRLPGRAVLVLRLEPARARDIERGLQRLDLRNVIAFRVIGDDEGVVRIAIALRNQADFDTFELRNRIVLDVDNRRFL